MDATAAVGIFDSGVGGLSLYKAIKQQLPQYCIFYIADSGHAPYGDRTAEYITERSLAISDHLHMHAVSAVVVACNTASAVAIDEIRAASSVPVVGIEPAIKPAAAITRSGVIGVLATTATVASNSVASLCDNYADDADVILQACPGLVEQIEKGLIDSPATYAMLGSFLEPMQQAGADTIVLGCTHYPFVAHLVQQIMGSNVRVINPAAAVARQLSRRLDLPLNQHVVKPSIQQGRDEFFTTGSVEQASHTMSMLLNKPVRCCAMPDAHYRVVAKV